MKHFYLIALFAILAFSKSFAGETIKAIKSNGNWNAKTTWDLDRVPANGDVIEIPASYIVKLTSVVNLSDVKLKVYGILLLSGENAELNLCLASVISLYSTGLIYGSDSDQKIMIGNTTVFTGASRYYNILKGPKMAHAGTGAGFGPFDALPVKFVGFSIALKAEDVLVQWSTSEEVNANMYEVERSTNGNDWKTVAYVGAAGNASTITNYSYTDKKITSKITYYRIKQIDLDGQFTYTPTKSVRTDVTTAKSDVKIASMSQGRVMLQFPKEIRGTVMVRLVSSTGQVVSQHTLNQPIGQVILNTNATLKGSYVVSVYGNELNTAGQVIL